MPDHNGSPTYEEWYQQADDIAGRIAGVDLDALGDGPSHERWSDGETPEAYVIERLEDAGYPFDETPEGDPTTTTRARARSWRDSGLRPSKRDPLIPEVDARGVARCPECRSRNHTAGQCRPGAHR